MGLFTERIGNLFDTERKIIGHGVNTQGDMSGGIAAMIAKRWPQACDDYTQALDDGSLQPGGYIQTPIMGGEKMLAHFASQILPGANAHLPLLVAAISGFAVDNPDGAEIAIPRIGAGIGGLDWETQVRPSLQILCRLMPQLSIEVWTLPETD